MMSQMKILIYLFNKLFKAMAWQETHRIWSHYQGHGHCAKDIECKNGQTRQARRRNKDHKYFSQIKAIKRKNEWIRKKVLFREIIIIFFFDNRRKEREFFLLVV